MHRRNKKDNGRREKLKRGWLMNWPSTVFPTCRTAESSGLKPFTQTGFGAEKTHVVIISSKNRRILCDDVWPVFESSNPLLRSWAHSHASSLRLQTQLNNQGFNCCIIPQSINSGFVGYLDEIKQNPQEANTENLSVREMRRSQISWGWEKIKRQRFQYAAAALPNQTKLLRDQNRPHCRILSLYTHQFMQECIHTQTRH